MAEICVGKNIMNKRFTSLMTTLILSVFFSISASAYDVEVDGIYYNLNYQDKTAEVTYKEQYSSPYDGEVYIRSSIELNGVEYKVTSIGEFAFSSCSGLTSIDIPNSVTSIGNNVLSGCDGIKNAVIANDMFVFLPEDYNGHYSIPDNIIKIVGGAFFRCTGLTSVDIPSSIKSIEQYTFSGCSGLTSINIPTSVTSIGFNAFRDCTGITSVNIPNSITSNDNEAFWGCSGLTTVTIPNSVTRIGVSAFRGCSGLISVNIPNSVTDIGYDAFWYCTSLTSVTIPNSITSIKDFIFYGCSGLTSVIIPNSVTRIEQNAFGFCSGLSSITIGSGVEKIEFGAFADCNNIETVTCLAKKVPNTRIEIFRGVNIRNCTLIVPESALQAYKTTKPWSDFGTIKAIEGTEGIKSVKARGIAIQSAGGFINISGLDNNEKVSFYGIDGKSLGTATSINGTTSFAAQSGSIVVAKIGKENIKIAVK